MKKLSFLFVLLSLGLSVSACKDDTTARSAEGEKCEVSGDCVDSLWCSESVCVARVEDGADCSANPESCKLGSSCVEGICKLDIVECSTASDCLASQFCKNNFCAPRVEAGGDCSGDAESCVEGNVCNVGICGLPLKPCTSMTECEASQFCNGEFCLSRLALGEDCTEGMDECAEGTICHYSACTMILGEGAQCSALDAFKLCDENLSLECIQKVCAVPDVEIPLGKGDECEGLSVGCNYGLYCTNGYCSQMQGERGDCTESNYNFCANGLLCVDNTCTKPGADCESNDDCTDADSYCCLEEKCQAVGKCLTYAEGGIDDTCLFKTKPGIFEAQLQCRWQPDSVGTGSSRVSMSPLVGKFGNAKGLKTTLAFYSHAATHVRIIDGETCENLESFQADLAAPKESGDDFFYPAAINLDADEDELLELVFVTATHRAISYKWNDATKKHEVFWTSKDSVAGSHINQTSLLAFDVNGDGKTEIIGSNGVVLNGQNGETIAPAITTNATTLALLNLDQDDVGIAELITGDSVYRWGETEWTKIASLGKIAPHAGYADFGTIGATAEAFDYTKLDGKPEIVLSGNNHLTLIALVDKGDGTYDAQELLSIRVEGGGPMTIGDFNNDGLPEIGLASSSRYGVYDPKCEAYAEGACADKYVLWERKSQASSGSLGSSLFDFDGDGQAEAVYADQCFVRVYEGKSGKVLFSGKRTATTYFEFPAIADIDGDGSAELIVGNDKNTICEGDSGSSQIKEDPIHEGIRCTEDEDCPQGVGCDLERGLCSCTIGNDSTCNADPKFPQQYTCLPPIHPQVGMYANIDGTGRKLLKANGVRPDGWPANSTKGYCRAWRKSNDVGGSDMLVYKDRLDRWVSSRELWNQHAYNIINIEDTGLAPTAKEWIDNWLLKTTIKINDTDVERLAYNNYRLNKQGLFGAGTAPDITGKFELGSICGKTSDGRNVIAAELCNRGTKPVAQNLPATFYYYDEAAPDNKGQKICTSYTKENVPNGSCQKVGCTISEAMLKDLANKKVLLVTNEDETGRPSTVECRKDNNTDTILVDDCDQVVIIVN